VVRLRQAGCCWRIQSQPRKLFKFGRIKHISSMFGGFANSIRLTKDSQSISELCMRFSAFSGKDGASFNLIHWGAGEIK
jgi:hypothetical protein